MIKRQTLTSQVIDHVLNLIKSGQVKTGEKLPTEKQLTAQLGVSRTCVREAMKSLESLRLVSVRPKIGAVVLDTSPSAVSSGESFSAFTHSQTTNVLIEFRKILEVGLASLAAAKATNEDLGRMARTLQDHECAVETHSIVYNADIAFHEAIADASKNPIAILALRMISKPLEEQRRKSDTVPNAAAEALEEHWKIYKAICAKNSARARAAMREHLATAERHWQIANAGDTEFPADLSLAPALAESGPAASQIPLAAKAVGAGRLTNAMPFDSELPRRTKLRNSRLG